MVKTKKIAPMEHIYKALNIQSNLHENNMIKNLFRKVTENKDTLAHIDVREKGYIYQTDLLFLPDDQGYRYALVVVDCFDNTVDAEPIKKKENNDVLKAFQKIFSRKYLKLPKFSIEVDNGSEFKGKVREYFHENNVIVRVATTGRHRQQALVESFNGIIGKLLFMQMTADEILTNARSVTWREELPNVVKVLNEYLDPPKRKTTDEIKARKNEEILDIGTKVRVALDYPVRTYDYYDEDEEGNKKKRKDVRLIGKFRVTDIRWSPDIYTVKDFFLRPNQPVFYVVDKPPDDKFVFKKSKKDQGTSTRIHAESVWATSPMPTRPNYEHPNNVYTRDQLQVFDENEVKPPRRKWVVERIVGKEIRDGEIYYKIKWKGVDEPNFQPKRLLVKDIPLLIDKYESDNK